MLDHCAFRVPIPVELLVVVGNAGNGHATLTFQRVNEGDDIVCRYRGGAATPSPETPEELAAGQRYHLERCTGEPDGTGRRVFLRESEICSGDIQVRLLN